MRYKTLGKTGLNVSVATVGTWAIGGSGWGAVDRQDSIAAIRSMLDNDVNIVDTAPIYGRGYSEEVVGEAIKGYDREKLIISTKCGLVWGEGAPKDGRDVSGKIPESSDLIDLIYYFFICHLCPAFLSGQQRHTRVSYTAMITPPSFAYILLTPAVSNTTISASFILS